MWQIWLGYAVSVCTGKTGAAVMKQIAEWLCTVKYNCYAADRQDIMEVDGQPVMQTIMQQLYRSCPAVELLQQDRVTYNVECGEHATSCAMDTEPVMQWAQLVQQQHVGLGYGAGVQPIRNASFAVCVRHVQQVSKVQFGRQVRLSSRYATVMQQLGNRLCGGGNQVGSDISCGGCNHLCKDCITHFKGVV